MPKNDGVIVDYQDYEANDMEQSAGRCLGEHRTSSKEGVSLKFPEELTGRIYIVTEFYMLLHHGGEKRDAERAMCRKYLSERMK